MKNKKLPLVIGLVVLLLVVVGGVVAYTRMRSPAGDATQQQAKKKKAEPVNVIAVAERPYIKIEPLADGHNVNLVVTSLNKPATEAEYELEYQAGSQLQGAFGLLKLDKLPAQFKILLGSCSAGGACSYHEGVVGGSLLAKFTGAENYAVKSNWRYIDNRAKSSMIGSTDAKFQLDAADLKTQRFLIVFNSPGYPTGLTGTPVSDPYSLTSSSPLEGQGTLTMIGSEEGQLTIMGWDGQTWKSFTTKMDGKSATATVDLMELYILVKN